MDFDLSKPQKLLKETARQFLARETSWQAVADQGWTELDPFAELVEVAVVMEEIGRACAPGPFLSHLFASALIRAAGSAEQQARWLPPMAAGELKATVAILDGSASWDVGSSSVVRSSSSTTDGPRPTTNQERRTIRKLFVLDADSADLILCVGPEGSVAVAAPLSIEPMPSMDESRRLFEVTLDPGEPLPGGKGAVRAAIDVATVALCAEMVGGMQWMLDAAVDYAKTRQQFGRAIGSFQAVQHQCADMLLFTESARSAAYYAAWETSPLAVSVAKAYCSDACREVGNRAVQVHGGIGFTWEHRLQLYYKRAKSSETMFGDATFHRERIAALVVDELPADVQNTRRGRDGVHDSSTDRFSASVDPGRVVRTGAPDGR